MLKNICTKWFEKQPKWLQIAKFGSIADEIVHLNCKSSFGIFFAAAKRKIPVGLTIQQKYDVITCLDNQTCSKSRLALKYQVTCNAISKIYKHQRNSVLDAIKSGKLQVCARRLRKSKLDTVGSKLYSWYCLQNPHNVSQNVLMLKAKEIATELNSTYVRMDKINFGWIHRWKKSHGVFRCKSRNSATSTAALSSTSGPSSSSISPRVNETVENPAFKKTCETFSKVYRKCSVALTLFQKYAIITALDNKTSNQSELSKVYKVTCNTISKIYNHQRNSVLRAIKSGEFETDAKRLRRTKLDLVGTQLLDWYWSTSLSSVADQVLLTKALEIAQGLEIQDVSGVNKSWIGRWKKSHGISQSKSNSNLKTNKSNV